MYSPWAMPNDPRIALANMDKIFPNKGGVETMKIIGTLECPYIKRKSARDESFDFCRETERPSGRIKPCLLEEGLECETWNEIRAEWEAEGGNQ